MKLHSFEWFRILQFLMDREELRETNFDCGSNGIIGPLKWSNSLESVNL